jgi:hypothetical protein
VGGGGIASNDPAEGPGGVAQNGADGGVPTLGGSAGIGVAAGAPDPSGGKSIVVSGDAGAAVPPNGADAAGVSPDAGGAGAAPATGGVARSRPDWPP